MPRCRVHDVRTVHRDRRRYSAAVSSSQESLASSPCGQDVPAGLRACCSAWISPGASSRHATASCIPLVEARDGARRWPRTATPHTSCLLLWRKARGSSPVEEFKSRSVTTARPARSRRLSARRAGGPRPASPSYIQVPLLRLPTRRRSSRSARFGHALHLGSSHAPLKVASPDRSRHRRSYETGLSPRRNPVPARALGPHQHRRHQARLVARSIAPPSRRAKEYVRGLRTS